MNASQTWGDIGTAVFFALGAVLFATVSLQITRFFRRQNPNPEKLSTYESGEDAIGTAQGRFNPRFYVIALIFLLFEAEFLFLFPWAVVFADSDLSAKSYNLWAFFLWGEMVIFIALLALGLWYVWRKGYLQWSVPQPHTQQFASPVPETLYEALNAQEYAASRKALPETTINDDAN